MQPPRKRFYEESWFKVWAPPLALLLLFALLALIPGATIASWLVDAIALAMMFFLTLALASQFVLPVRTLRERRQAVERLIEYVSGLHGPIVFVRDGELVGNAAELNRSGMGVILVDGSSAVVLERGRRFSRAEGPGIVFTRYKERLAATFDLRKQSRSLDTHALTRDGIELKAAISVTFALDPGDQLSPREAPDERDILSQARITPAFPFNPESAFRAYHGFAVTDNQKVLKWTELPVIVATEFFRDQVSRLTLDDLFQPLDPESSPVAALQTRLTDQVRQANLLVERGIKVYSVSIGTLELPTEVNQQRVRAWAARWQRESMMALANAEVEAERVKERAKAEAQAEMIAHFRAYLTGGGEEGKKEIARKFVNALSRAASDPVTSMLLPGETMRQLSHLRVWEGLKPGGNGDSVKVIGKVESEDLSEIVAEDVAGSEDSHPVSEADRAEFGAAGGAPAGEGPA